MGPSKGIPESMRAAEAPLMASTSCGFSRSAPITVTTTWVSLRYPSTKLGRSGRSMRRQVRMALSVGRPSRRKNEPGIFPAAYIRSSMSTVSGKKSIPSRGLLWLAVASTTVPPSRPTTAPWDWVASLPVSNDSSLSDPSTGADTRMASAMSLLSVERRPVPSRRAPHGRAGWGLGDWQLTAALLVVARRAGPGLPAQPEAGVDGPVALHVVPPQVRLQAPPAPHQLEQAPPTVVVALVHPEVLVEVVDALREEGDLDLGRTGVGLVEPVLLDGGCGIGHGAVAVAFGVASAVPDGPGGRRAPGQATRRPRGRPSPPCWGTGRRAGRHRTLCTFCLTS